MSKSGNSLFMQSNSIGQIFIIIYVDDLLIGDAHLADINKVKTLLSGSSKWKNEWTSYFLGIKVIQICNGIMLSLRHYILSLLFKFGMTDLKPISTPLNRKLKLHANFDTSCEPTQYRQTIGSLIYLTITWPDLNYLVSLLRQFMQSHTTHTWSVLRKY